LDVLANGEPVKEVFNKRRDMGEFNFVPISKVMNIYAPLEHDPNLLTGVHLIQ